MPWALHPVHPPVCRAGRGLGKKPQRSALAPLHGADYCRLHPQGIGRDGDRCWAEFWRPVGPQAFPRNPVMNLIMLVLISYLVGVALREWRQCRRLRHRTLTISLLVPSAAMLLLTHGNYLGDLAATRGIALAQ